MTTFLSKPKIFIFEYVSLTHATEVISLFLV